MQDQNIQGLWRVDAVAGGEGMSLKRVGACVYLRTPTSPHALLGLNLHLRVVFVSHTALGAPNMHSRQDSCGSEQSPVQADVSMSIDTSCADTAAGRNTHHSKAAKTVAACAHLHTLPRQ
jgi:hypothetical protein